MGFPGGSEVKASACNAGDLGSIPGLGRSPGEGNGNPLQYSCLENPIDGGAWWATVHRVAKSRTQLSDFTHSYPYQLLSYMLSHVVVAVHPRRCSGIYVTSQHCSGHIQTLQMSKVFMQYIPQTMNPSLIIPHNVVSLGQFLHILVPCSFSLQEHLCSSLPIQVCTFFTAHSQITSSRKPFGFFFFDY